MWNRIKEKLAKISLLRSLRVRIFLLLMVMGIVPSNIIKNALLDNYEERAVNVKISEVSNQFKIIANHLIHYNYLQDNSSDVINAELDQISNLYDGRVLIINSNFRVIKDTYGISEGKTIISEEVIKCFQGENTTYYDDKDGFIEMTIPIGEFVTGQTEQKSQIKGVLLGSISTDTIALTISILQRKAFVLEVVMYILIFVMSMGISHLLIVPFRKVTNAISQVKEGYTDAILMAIRGISAKSGLAIIFDWLDYECEKQKNGTNTFTLDYKMLLEKLKAAVAESIDSYRAETPGFDMWFEERIEFIKQNDHRVR